MNKQFRYVIKDLIKNRSEFPKGVYRVSPGMVPDPGDLLLWTWSVPPLNTLVSSLNQNARNPICFSFFVEASLHCMVN